ncbi:hypothetical protein [Truepera radiovictrix]|uniref:hypothetical protein n=1 Tax=Truepera radiovictrix TaxID=332249 RepID=UPI00067476EC|nr:hypothetical protein [Truepera radiovictrix]WMT56561.1 hypothetical protein RCV51_11170 [Truepera radiovictrix]
MKRTMILTLTLLAACAPAARPENNVRPTLVSATAPQQVGGRLVLQGRYFGDGAGGAAEGSYVLVAADASGAGGARAQVESWAPDRITLLVPEGVGYGYVFVVVDGVQSNGLPVNAP